jgi:uncharacterized protein (DUF362 family)
MNQNRRSSSIVNRRSFLRNSVLGVSVLASGTWACSSRSSANQTERSPRAVRHRLPDEPVSPKRSRIAVVATTRLPTYRAAIHEAVARAGGLGFIQAGETVLLKPALNSANSYPATTDPETVSIVAEMVKEAGGRPWVADRTMFLNSTEEAFRKTEIYGAAEQSGIPCRPLEDDEASPIHHPLAEHWAATRIPIYVSVIEADHIINLCTPRTHKLGDFTMAMKNNVGVVNGWSRLRMHVPWGLKERLAEINLVVRPSLIVMDGREGFADGGPDSGALVRPGFIAAGSDPLAIDAVGLAYLRLEGANEDISGRSIWEIPMMKRAAEIGLGVRGSRQIELAGVDPATEAALRAEMA